MTGDTTTNSNLSLNDSKIAFASRSNAELVKMDWMFSLMNHPMLNKLSTQCMLLAIKWHIPIKFIVKPSIFRHFCGGETLEECIKTMDSLKKFNIGTILDYSVEGEKSESGFDHVLKETIATIEIAAKRTDIPFAVFKTSGICDVTLLEKFQSKKILSPSEKEALEKGRQRFATICKVASTFGVRLFVDGEETWIQDAIDAWTYEEMENYNQERAIIFNTFQLYRSDMLGNLIRVSEKARSKNFVLGAKLVRGAYMEKEAAFAKKNNLKNPIQPSKEATDWDFDLGLQHCIDHIDFIHFCAGSHNEVSNLKLAKAIDSLGLQRNDNRIWFAQLFGMSDNISYALASAGFNVAKYVPFGPVLSVMPYLIRRAAENTSVAGQTSRELSLIKKERVRRKS
jgi:proline dehydrogenase